MPRLDNQTVLDIVTYVQRSLDPGLGYRFACRVGMCGSCAMTVNGTPRWTCRTHVSRVAGDGSLEIAPLRNLPVVKDLSVDMRGFFEKMAKAGLIILLAAHLTGGVRLLALEFLPWMNWQKTLVAASGGLSLAAGLLFLVNAY